MPVAAAALAAAALALALSAIGAPPDDDVVPAPEVMASRGVPTPDCLIDLAFTFAIAEEAPPRSSPTVTALAVSGAINNAEALLIRIERFHGAAPEAAQRKADDRLASHRVAQAIRTGRSVEDAIAETTGVDAGALWIAALSLTGHDPYGVGPLPGQRRFDDPPDPATAAEVQDLARRIERMALADPDAPST